MYGAAQSSKDYRRAQWGNIEKLNVCQLSGSFIISVTYIYIYIYIYIYVCVCVCVCVCIYLFVSLFYDNLLTFQLRCFYGGVNSRCFLLGFVALYLVSWVPSLLKYKMPALFGMKEGQYFFLARCDCVLKYNIIKYQHCTLLNTCLFKIEHKLVV